MAQRLRTHRTLLMLLGTLLAASAYGEESQILREGANATLQARKELAASISRREVDLVLRKREDVLMEVKKRIQEMALNASSNELTDLLKQSAQLAIASDKCRLQGRADRCRSVEAELANVEASFRKKAGVSTREFRSGVRDIPGRNGLQDAGRRSNSKATGETCACTFKVFSSDRWMSGSWGLECHGHASHGVCSNNVDSFHTPGIGAMTGSVTLFFDTHRTDLLCPDDQKTCFRGPSLDHLGSWGNACNCDTFHSQYYNPYIEWYGGDLTDSTRIEQMPSTAWFTVPGACDSAYVAVHEFIQENDPWCCDDPMGDLWVSLPLSYGSGTTSSPASAQNCNGGSQSGMYPYCGTFGATIQVEYTCYPGPSCDPTEEQYCRDIGYFWNASNCSCEPPCAPESWCAEYDYYSCTCARGING